MKGEQAQFLKFFAKIRPSDLQNYRWDNLAPFFGGATFVAGRGAAATVASFFERGQMT
jgi:hypothetical protein